MKRRNPVAFARLMATTSVVALSLAVAPIVLPPHLGGAAHSYADSGDSCFLAGTRVLMADGSERPIEQVRVGDLVRSGRGGANRVVGIESPRLGDRLLYAFNGGPPFVTAEHPFLTMAGWKAIDPQATARENASLNAAALIPGDLLWRARRAFAQPSGDALARVAEVSFWVETLREITAMAGNPATVVYNLLLSGDHTYIAAGYVVHNKGDSGGDSGGGDSGGDNGGSDSGSGDHAGSDSGGGDSGGDHGGSDSGEHSSSGEDHGGSSGSDSGKSGDSAEIGKSGTPELFPGDPGEADRDLTPAEEESLIERGWK